MNLIAALSCYIDAQGSPHIDYVTLYLWALNWSWFDPLKAQVTWPTVQKKALEYLHRHIRDAEQVGKPLTMENFGIPRDSHSYSPASPVTCRDRCYELMFAEIYRSARSGSPIADKHFRGWGGEGRASDSTTCTWNKGDDYNGDPPQEPQGRNSAFAQDLTTIKMLQQYAKTMNALK